jgi:hypothetical protein
MRIDLAQQQRKALTKQGVIIDQQQLQWGA